MLKWLRRLGLKSPEASEKVSPALPDHASPLSAEADVQVDSLVKQGNSFLDQGRLAEAARCYRGAIAIHPQLAVGYVNLGFVLKEMGQLAEAAEQLEHALRLDPKQFDALFLLGLKAQAEGDSAKAAAYLLRCHEQRPDFDLAAGPLCNALQEDGKLDQAEAIARTALEFHPHSADLHCVMAGVQAARGMFAEALLSCDRAIKFKADHAGAWSSRGLALNSLRQSQQALQSLEHSIRLDPDSADAHNNLGVVLTSLKDYGAAIFQIDRALELRPDFVLAMLNRAHCLTLLHRHEP